MWLLDSGATRHMIRVLPIKMGNPLGGTFSPTFDNQPTTTNNHYLMMICHVPLPSASTICLSVSDTSTWMKVGYYSKGTSIILQLDAYTCLFWAFSMDKGVIWKIDQS